MWCHNEPPAGQMPPIQHLPQIPLSGASLPSRPPAVVFNTLATPFYYPAMSPVSPQPQPLSMPQSHVPVPEDQPPWFQTLVDAVFNEVKEKSEKRAVDERKAMSVEDERRLVEALRKQRAEGGITMLEMFEELSQNNGHSEAVWKTWFIENYERLESKIVHVGHSSEASGSRHQRFPTRISTRIRTMSRETSSDDRGVQSTSHARLDGSAPQHYAMKDGRTKAAPTRARVPSRASKHPVPITSADLRAMTLYRYENGDDAEVRRYGRARWREFAARPENRKRTLAAWICIPRADPRHAAAIDQYVEEYRKEAEGTKSTMACEPFTPENPRWQDRTEKYRQSRGCGRKPGR